MNNIVNLIATTYGVSLNETQFRELIEWFKNDCKDVDDEEFQGKLEVYLSEKYGQILLLEEDLENINYLLLMLRDATRSK